MHLKPRKTRKGCTEIAIPHKRHAFHSLRQSSSGIFIILYLCFIKCNLLIINPSPDLLPSHPSGKPDPRDSGPGGHSGSGRVLKMSPGPDPNRTLPVLTSYMDSLCPIWDLFSH